jgi:iron complex outermembrane recepter protein
VRLARGFGNYQELYLVRGLPVSSDDMGYNGLYSVLPRQFVAAELLERVEVLKGASAFLNGASPGGAGGGPGGVGGAINLLPKRAPNAPLSKVTVGVESGGQGYVHTDLARRFGPDQALGLRINALRRDGDTAVEGEKRQLSALTAGLDYRTPDLRLSADLGYQNHQLDHAQPAVTVLAGVPVPSAPDAKRNIGQPWEYSKERDTFGTLRGEYDIAPNLTAWAAVGGREGHESVRVASPVSVSNAAGDFTAYRFDSARRDSIATGELGIRGKLRTGAVGHSLSIAASAFRLDSRNAYDYYASTFASNLHMPGTHALPGGAPFSGGDLGAPRTTQKTETRSVAVVDTLSMLDERLLLTVGARTQKLVDTGYDYTSGAQATRYSKTRTTPMAGVVFKPARQVSLYANYIEGLAKGPTAFGTNIVNQGQVFAPYVARQKEVGVKYDGGSIGADVSFFVTSVPSARTVATGAGTLFDVSGEQRNRGAEISVFGEPVRGVRLLGGLTLLDAKLRRTQGGLTDGNDAIGTPDTQFNLGAEWDVPGARGLTLTGRAIHTSAQFADAANTQRVPAWHRVDLGARYLMEVGGKLVTLRANVENVANRNYWASSGGYPGYGYLVTGAPRTFVLSAGVEF